MPSQRLQPKVLRKSQVYPGEERADNIKVLQDALYPHCSSFLGLEDKLDMMKMHLCLRNKLQKSVEDAKASATSDLFGTTGDAPHL